MKRSKKFLSLLLSLLMIIASLPLMAVSSFAQDESANDFDYEFCDEDVIGITKYNGSAANLDIPSEIDGYTVREIYDGAFRDCTSLVSVKIPDTVESIGVDVFYGCSSLESIEADEDNGVYSSENGVLFSNGKAVLVAYPMGKEAISYTVPDSVTAIGETAFKYCKNLITVTVPNSVEIIENEAFEFCYGLESITLPDSVKHIGNSAFFYCRSLENVTFGNKIEYVGSDVIGYTAYYNNSDNWENGGLYIGKYLLTVGKDVGTEFTVKDGTVNIADCAVSYCENLASVTLPETVEAMGETPFYQCPSLESISVKGSNGVYSSKDGVLFVGSSLAVYPQGRKAVQYAIPVGTDLICDYAFLNNMYLESVTIPDSVERIGNSAFSLAQSLKSVTVPGSVEEIYSMAFNCCEALENLTISNGVGHIGAWAFLNCISLKSVTIPGSVYLVEEGAFDGCTSLSEVALCNGVNSIGDFAFAECSSISKVTIPNSVEYIGMGAFYGCTSLESVTIPKSVTTIEDYAFGYYYDESNDEDVKDDSFTVYGVSGSEAENYANNNEFAFVEIPEITFPDVANEAWYYNAVKFNVDKGYFHGYANGYFGPADNIQRQDFVVVLAKIANADLSAYEGQNGDFDDVPTNDYYSAAVAWAKDNHILSGYANGKFGVGDPITREQACVIFFNYITGYCDMGVGSSNTPEEICSRYPDGNAVSDWAKTAVAWAAENHVVGGNGKLNPAGNANRAEMAQIIMNMSNNGIL